ncbi:LamG domain-containing protein [Bacteriovoracaceae bacterium]|nr:LamG domain-containing protein [Bacteriovoracaceae bacterium]
MFYIFAMLDQIESMAFRSFCRLPFRLQFHLLNSRKETDGGALTQVRSFAMVNNKISKIFLIFFLFLFHYSCGINKGKKGRVSVDPTTASSAYPGANNNLPDSSDNTLLESLASLDGFQGLLINTSLTKTSITDQSGYDRNTFAGKNYNFDGTDDYIDLKEQVSLTTDFTISFWINPDSLTNLVLFGEDSTTDNYIMIDSATDITTVFNSNSVTITHGHTFATGTTQFIVITRESGVVSIYLDGIAPSSTQTNNSNFDFDYIAAYNDLSANFYDGKIWDIRVHASALSSSEISSLFSDPSQKENYTLYLKTEEGDGEVSFDSSMKENHGIIINATLSTFHEENNEVIYSDANQNGYSNYLHFFNNDNLYNVVDTINRGDTFSLAWSQIALVNQAGGATVIRLREDGNAEQVRITWSTDDISINTGSSGGLDTYSDILILGEVQKFVWVYNYNTSTGNLYLNGNDLGSVSIPMASASHTPDVIIGAATTGAISSFEGMIWDIRFYNNTLLSTNEITQYSSGLETTTTPSHWWKLHPDDINLDSAGSVNLINANPPAQLIIPMSETNSNKDVLDVDLSYTGRVNNNFNMVNSNTLCFDGVDDSILTPSLPIGTSDFSISFWVNPLSLGTQDNILNSTTLSSTRLIILRNGSAPRIKISGSNYNLSGFTQSIGTWEHLTITYDRDGNADIYSNGEFQSSSDFSPEVAVDLTSSYYIGYRQAGSDIFHGCLADFRIYSDLLTSTEVTSIYEGTNITDNLLLHYPMAEGAGVNIFDISGNGNHGVMQDFLLSSAWGSTQNNYHFNLINGFTESDGSYVLASDVLINGDFTTTTGWTPDGSSSVAGGFYSGGASTGLTYKIGVVEDQREYLVSYTVSNYVGGSFRMYLQGTNGQTVNADGDYSENIIAGSSNTLTGINPSSFDGEVDDITIIEVAPNTTKVPIELESENDIFDNELNNPAGVFHNNAETCMSAPNIPLLHAINDNEGNNFLFDGSRDPQVICYNDLSENINTTGYFFFDISIDNERKNFVIFDDPKSGNDLGVIQNLLNH